MVVLTLFTPFNLQASTDNKYQKSFRSFKRVIKGCTTSSTTPAKVKMSFDTVDVTKMSEDEKGDFKDNIIAAVTGNSDLTSADIDRVELTPGTARLVYGRLRQRRAVGGTDVVIVLAPTVTPEAVTAAGTSIAAAVGSGTGVPIAVTVDGVDTTVKAPTPTVTQADITTSTAASTTPIFDLRSCSNMDNEQGAAAFDEELTEYFRDASECEDCLNATTAEVSPWPQQLPQCMAKFPNLMQVAGRALSTDTADWLPIGGTSPRGKQDPLNLQSYNYPLSSVLTRPSGSSLR